MCIAEVETLRDFTGVQPAGGPERGTWVLPLNQPYAPVLLAAATKHLTTMLFSSFRIS